MKKGNDNEYRIINDENEVDRLFEAWIMWAKTALELSDIIDTLYKQYQTLDDPQLMKQIIEMAYKAKNDRIDHKSINEMRSFIKNNILIEMPEE